MYLGVRGVIVGKTEEGERRKCKHTRTSFPPHKIDRDHFFGRLLLLTRGKGLGGRVIPVWVFPVCYLSFYAPVSRDAACAGGFLFFFFEWRRLIQAEFFGKGELSKLSPPFFGGEKRVCIIWESAVCVPRCLMDVMWGVCAKISCPNAEAAVQERGDGFCKHTPL